MHQSISKRGFVLLHTLDEGHDLGRFFPFATFPRGRSIGDYKVDSEARGIYVFTHATSISMHVHVYF